MKRRIEELEAKSELTVKERIELQRLKHEQNDAIGMPKTKPGKSR